MNIQTQDPFIYGTAWKRDETKSLVSQAIKSGFTAFDTAAQPKHYREDLVGEAIRGAFECGILKNRADIYMQTKFSRPSVQEPSNCPYPLDAAIEEQVRISIENSLRNLRHIDDESEEIYIDTLILHSPYPDFSDTLKAWRIFESYVPHRIRALGISNITLPILKQLYDAVKIKPVFVQNRFYPESAFDVPLRKFCAEKEIVFQAHKVLKGNKNLLDSELLRDIASNFGFTVEIAFYFCVLGLVGGVQVVNGTKSEEHMKEDLESLKTFKQWLLDPKNQASWDQKMMLFKSMIGDASL